MAKLSKFFNYQSREQEIAENWKQSGFYKFTNEQNVFAIDTPPPTVSGSLHMGHVFSYVQADIIARYKRIMGFNVFYPIGFDDNGLPTERLVEKKTGKKVGKNATKEEFILECNKVVDEAEKNFESLLTNIGLSVDFNLKYQTISSKTAKISQQSFIDLWNKGLIYQKLSPVYWDVIDKTALAQADIEDKELEGLQITYKALLEEKPNEFKILEIMTTRAEMIPACVCVLYHPEDIRYNKLKDKNILLPCNGLEYKLEVPLIADEDVVMEKGTGLVMCCAFGDIQDKIWIERHKLLDNIKTWECVIKKEKTNNLISDNGFLNADIFKQENGNSLKVAEGRKFIIERMLSANLIVGSSNSMSFEEALQSSSVKLKKVLHNVKCAERSGKPVEILLKNQWYLSILPFQRDLLELIKKINFYPSYMKVRLEKWIEGLNQDWCISRDRFFGINIPVRSFEFDDIVSRETIINIQQDFYLNTFTPFITKLGGIAKDDYFEIEESKLADFMESKDYLDFEDGFVLNALEMEVKNIGLNKYCLQINRNIDNIFSELLQDFKTEVHNNTFVLDDENIVKLEKLIDEKKEILEEIGIKNLKIKTEDLVFDTWFTSSISPQVAWGNLDNCPVFDLRPQAHEIIRTWTFYTIVKSYFHSLELKNREKIPNSANVFNSREFFRIKENPNIIPWKNVMLSGWCLAADKTKMSKSKGNIITPIDLIKNKGVDVIRLWCGSASLGLDTVYSEDVLEQNKKFTNKLWNVFKFFDLQQEKLVQEVKIIEGFDTWILAKLKTTIEIYQKNMNIFEYAKAKDVIDGFFWNDLCDNYLEIIKVRYYGVDALIYKDKQIENPDEVKLAQQSCIKTLEFVLKGILTLYAPFTPFITEELSQLFFNNSVNKVGSLKNLYYPMYNYDENITSILTFIDLVRKYKTENSLSMNAELDIFDIPKKIDLTNYLEDLKNVTGVKNFNFI